MKRARSLVDATNVAKEYFGADAIRAVTNMLEALEESYKADLADVDTDGLIALQSKLKQTQAIRKVLSKEMPLPKI